MIQFPSSFQKHGKLSNVGMHRNICNKPMEKKAKELLCEAQHSGCLWGGKTGR